MRDVLHLRPAVAEGEHALAAGLAPAHRAADLLGDPAEQQLLGVGADLGAEAAADVGGDDADLAGLEPVGGLDRRHRALGVLGREPLVEPTVDPRHRRAAHLERARGDPLVDDPLRDDDLAALEELVAGHVGHAHERGVEHHVAAGALVDQRRCW